MTRRIRRLKEREIMNTEKQRTDKLSDVMAFRRDRFGLVADIFTHESSEETIAHIIAHASDVGQELDGSIESALSKELGSLRYDDFSSFAVKTRTEYARLFLGPREVLAPLHESAYLSGTSRMFTAETLAVRRFYERYGYMMKAKNSEPDDSVGTELEFLRNLCDGCLALHETGLDQGSIDECAGLIEAQSVFKEQHLNRWIAKFAQRVIENDRSGYYRAWAIYLLGVLKEDDDLLSECKQLLVSLKSGL